MCFSSREWPFAGKHLVLCVFPALRMCLSISSSVGEYLIFFSFHEWKHNSHNENNRKLSCSNKTPVFSLYFIQMEKQYNFRTGITQLETLGCSVSRWPLFHLILISVLCAWNLESPGALQGLLQNHHLGPCSGSSALRPESPVICL